MEFDRHSVAIALGFSCFVAIVTLVPNLAAERFQDLHLGVRAVPLEDEDLTRVDQTLKVPGVALLSSRRLHGALVQARASALAEYEEDAILQAREALLYEQYARAEMISQALVDQLGQRIAEFEAERREADDEDDADAAPSPDELRELAMVRDQARLLLANVLMKTGRPKDALEHLRAISPENPVDDFVVYLQGESLETMGEFATAAERFEQVAGMARTPLEHRARVRRAHALFKAEKWEEAAKALDEVLAAYPEYPRRHQALYERAFTLENLGRVQEAADAYQQMWFEFPYHRLGKKARARLAEMEKGAVVPSRMLTARERYERFRRLRINKHWDDARELFEELQQDYATEDGHSDFEHDIEFQLALNAYASRNWNEAERRLRWLLEAYESGHRDGISRYLTWKYLSRTLARKGDFNGALAALERMTEGFGRYSKLRERAEFFEDHGRPHEARKLYDQFYSASKKRGWHYTWLLYKTGEFEQAYENLSRLAQRSGGQRRAKYLYWAARTLERAGKDDEARAIFADLASTYELSYYGLQASNRLKDLDQRNAVDGQLVASAQGIASSADDALDAMEDAAEGVEGSVAVVDPRAHPRNILWNERHASIPALDAEQCREDSLDAICEIAPDSDDVEEQTPFTSLATARLAPGSELEPAFSGPPASVADDEDRDDVPELDRAEDDEAKVPTRKVKFERGVAPRVDYSTSARIYWEGRMDSATAFARWREGEVVGPMPETLRAYDEEDYVGGLRRAVDAAGPLFPELERAYWLWMAGMEKAARWSARDVAIEFRELSRRWRPGSRPHELPTKRWDYYIDNRRRGRAGFWGLKSDELRYPVPRSASARRALLERQQAIHEQRQELRPLILDALKEVGDYFMVRKYTLGTGGWYRQDPRGPARTKWMQAYPRAFPRLVVKHAMKNGVNPYLLWSLMTVESSFNPDSLSTADALGLLQVIPRTGLKTAIMLGDENFGPMDLLEEDVAIEHGAFYFSKLVQKFRGQELFAIAGYNGGPHRVGDWVDMRGDTMPMDEFVEEIPFTQARGYTKKVLRFLALYLKIYEETDELYVGQNIRVNYRPHPKF